ncbi:carbohydrate ABC transporter permease [Thermosphaera aggregans]|uniref:Binding-protein-dependent transport systems inner membrane component n=1 Tax=Thermosphaera aggregans (strain DSM 11486 / M11TL) TaxID=633148 RepID=D5U2P2_THEAM|nr:carbohydrate ABC transporter permease [Thermosphaera aggregans]ADG91392.1 binding-protein-dependent transport systems inner membrane component [Thermosphaera aggregans DSM 11486]
MRDYRKATRFFKLRKYLKLGVLIAIVLVYLLPIYGMFNLAFRPRAEMFSGFFVLTQPTLENFVEAYEYGAYSAIVNSVIITVGGVGLALTLSVLASYAFSRFNVKGKNLLMFYILSTRMMPPITLIIPIFIMYYTIGLKGTYLGLILVYGMMALPLSVWMTKSFIDDVPKDIDEAAIIDGHSTMYILFKIVLPMVAPGIAASAAFAAITIWNEFLFALLLSGIDTKPTSVLLSSIRGERGFNWGRVAAIEVIYIIPIIILVFWLQKHMLRGLTFGTVRR